MNPSEEPESDSLPAEAQPLSGSFEFSTRLVRVRRTNRVQFSDEPLAPPAPPTRRPAKLAQLLATAHYIEGLIQSGEVEHRADAARRLEVSRTRVTQLIDLTLLAPDIQEEILFAEAVEGREPFSERDARKVLRAWDWPTQRVTWRAVRARKKPAAR